MHVEKYTKTAIILHWLIGLCILLMFVLGWYMHELPKDAPKQMAFDLFDLGIINWQLAEEASPRTFYFNLHKSIGVTLLGLIIFRIIWRITHTPPALLDSLKVWEKKLSTAVHHAMYLFMLAVPVSGLIMAINSKYGVMWFGMDFIKGLDNAGMRDVFKEWHEATATFLFLLILVHVAGALKHAIIDKDGTMKRMTFK